MCCAQGENTVSCQQQLLQRWHHVCHLSVCPGFCFAQSPHPVDTHSVNPAYRELSTIHHFVPYAEHHLLRYLSLSLFSLSLLSLSLSLSLPLSPPLPPPSPPSLPPFLIVLSLSLHVIPPTLPMLQRFQQHCQQTGKMVSH